VKIKDLGIFISIVERNTKCSIKETQFDYVVESLFNKVSGETPVLNVTKSHIISLEWC
jgi:hypothetical protein